MWPQIVFVIFFSKWSGLIVIVFRDLKGFVCVAMSGKKKIWRCLFVFLVECILPPWLRNLARARWPTRDTQLQRKNYSSSTGFQSLLTCNEVLARIVKTAVSGHECGGKKRGKEENGGKVQVNKNRQAKKKNKKKQTGICAAITKSSFLPLISNF